MRSSNSPKPRVGISACLLGEPVRYDGGDKRDPCITDTLADCFEWLPVCPEVGAGLGVPRPPVKLVAESGQLLALGVDNPSLDVTDALESFSRAWLEELSDLSGFILKSRSPSCGLHDTLRFDAQGEEQGRGDGLFTRILIQCYPHLPVEDENGIHDPVRRKRFISRVLTYAQENKAI
ncbi:DUF523 domain-containing protein [Pseudomonadota bacterium]